MRNTDRVEIAWNEITTRRLKATVSARWLADRLGIEDIAELGKYDFHGKVQYIYDTTEDFEEALRDIHREPGITVAERHETEVDVEDVDWTIQSHEL